MRRPWFTDGLGGRHCHRFLLMLFRYLVTSDRVVEWRMVDAADRRRCDGLWGKCDRKTTDAADVAGREAGR